MSLRDKHYTAPTVETVCQNTSSAEVMKFANPGFGAGGARAQVLEMHGNAWVLVHCMGPGAGDAWGCTGPGALCRPWCKRCMGADAGGAQELVLEVCSMSCTQHNLKGKHNSRGGAQSHHVLG